MKTDASPHQTPPVYLAHLDAVGNRRGADLGGIWEADGVVEFPYATSLGSPSRLAGIDAIAAYFGDLELFGPFTFGEVAAWPIDDDGNWFAELHGSATLLATGSPYEQDYVVRFRIAPSGRLAWMREYWDPTRA